MTISLKPLSFYAESKEPLNSAEKAYFRAKMKRKVHGLLLKRFSAMSEDDRALRSLIADRIGVHRSQVTRWLASPNNLTLDTLSDLLLAMNREMTPVEAEIGVTSTSNYTHPTSTLDVENETQFPKSPSGKTDEEPVRIRSIRYIQASGNTSPTFTSSASVGTQ